jgi:hypothetical protein
LAGICGQCEKVTLPILWIVLTYALLFCRSRHDLALEVLALRHQLRVLQRQAPSQIPIDYCLRDGVEYWTGNLA